MVKKRRQNFLQKVWNLKYLLIIVLVFILIIYFNVFVAGGAVLYEDDSNFSTGTFTNTTIDDGVRLKRLVPVGSYNDSDSPYSISQPYSVFVSGNYSYIVAYSDSLTILNVTNKSNPTPVGEYIDSNPPYSIEYPHSVFVLGDYAYVTSYVDDSLTIINISDKTSPTGIGEYIDLDPPYSLENALGVYVSGDYAYVAAYFDDAITILNVTNKSNPTPVGEYIDSEPPYSVDDARFVFVLEDYAYVTSARDDSLTILNISDKSNPTGVGDYIDTEPPYSVDDTRSVFVLGDYAYVTSKEDDSLVILNISDKSNPTPVGEYIDSELPYSLDDIRSVFVSGDYAYATSYNDDSLTMLNISNKSNPIVVGDYNDSDPPYSLDGATSVFVLGDYVYVISEADHSLTILSINHYSSGIYESEIFNVSSIKNWTTVSWNETEPTDTNLSLAFRSCDDSVCDGESWSSWEDDSPSILGGISNNRYFQYKAKLETTNTSKTPKLNSVNISYCTESWSYSSWSICSGDIKTRTATDANNCGTTNDRLALSQACSGPETIVSYEDDSDFSTGTFTNITIISDSVRLDKKIVPIGEYNASVSPYSIENPYSIYVLGDYAYVTTYYDSLVILNISDKSDPTPVGDYNDSDPPYSIDIAASVFVLEDFAYVTSLNDHSLTILNVSNKSNITAVADYIDIAPPYSIENPYSVFVLGDYAYVTSQEDDSLTILNVTNKSSPTGIGQYIDSDPPYSLDGAFKVQVIEDYAYLTAIGDESFVILNISDKTSPATLGSYVDTVPPYSIEDPYAFFVSGNYAYVVSQSDDSLTILNISDKTNPTGVGEYIDTEPPYSIEFPYAVFVSGDYAYATSYSDDSLTILNISNKSNPTAVGNYSDSDLPYSLDAVNSIFVLGDYIYTISWEDDSLTILSFKYSSGIYESEIFSIASVTDWTAVSWNETEPTDTNLSLAFRSCDDSLCSGESWSSWDDDSPNSLSGISNNKYFQFKANLETTNISKTPRLNSINIYSCTESWTSCTAWSVCSSGSIQTRTCTDANDCGTTSSRPAISQVCVPIGGGSGVTAGQATETNIITDISPDQPVETIIDNPDIDITKITVEVNEEIQSASVTITTIDVLPQADLQIGLSSGESYQLFKIETTGMNDTNVENVTIEFKVNKTWLDEQNETLDQISLYRKPGQANHWDSLPTSYLNEDDDYYYFSAFSIGFSEFLVFIANRVCTPGDKRCIDGQVQSCLENHAWKIIEYCQEGCRRDRCASKGFFLRLFALIILIGAVSLLILYFIFKSYLKKHPKKTFGKNLMLKKKRKK